MSIQSTEQAQKTNVASGGVAGVVEGESNGSKASGKSAKPKANKAVAPAADRETLINLYYQMLLIRRFEEKCAESYSIGKIGGFCHLYIGQEAVGVGAISVLRQDDYVLTSYREHGQAIAKGMSPDAVMAELYGKAGGCSQGKGGSMHLFNSEINFMGGHAIVGGQIPLATGVAFAAKYQETDRVAVCFFGEAAVNQGAFHESLNMAQLWKLPCIYICENNKYGMGTSLARAMSAHDISEKALSYEMASEVVDGMDVIAMRECMQRAVDRARRDSLPTLIEARTYRFMGHSMSDPGKYRTREEIEKNQERDPLTVLLKHLEKDSLIDEKKIAELEAQVKQEVEKSVKFADESPLPDERELLPMFTPIPLMSEE